MNKIYLLFGIHAILIILIIILLYRNNQPPVGELTVELKIHDRCPKTILIENDTITFSQGNVTNQTRINETGLKQYILDNKFFSLRENYAGTRCCDFVANTINITIGNKTKAVYCYNECPEKFENIKNRIISLWPNEIPYCSFA